LANCADLSAHRPVRSAVLRAAIFPVSAASVLASKESYERDAASAGDDSLCHVVFLVVLRHHVQRKVHPF